MNQNIFLWQKKSMEYTIATAELNNIFFISVYRRDYSDTRNWTVF